MNMVIELLIDCLSASMHLHMCGAIDRSGSSAAVISLAVLADRGEQAESIRIETVISDFGIPVIPLVVPKSGEDSAIALAAQNAAITADEFIAILSRRAESSLSRGDANAQRNDEEAPAMAKPRAKSLRRMSAGATTGGRRTRRRSRK